MKNATISSDVKSQFQKHLQEFAHQYNHGTQNRYIHEEKGLIQYYQIFEAQQPYMYEPQWGVYPTESCEGRQYVLLHDFLKSTALKQTDQFRVMVMHYLMMIQSKWSDDRKMSAQIVDESEQIQKSQLQISRQNDSYISLLIALTLNIPMGPQNKMRYTYKNGMLCPQTKIIIDLAIYGTAADSSQISLCVIFLRKEDIILDNKIEVLSPMAILKGYILEDFGQWNKVIFINQVNWNKEYTTRETQEEFFKDLLDE